MEWTRRTSTDPAAATREATAGTRRRFPGGPGRMENWTKRRSDLVDVTEMDDHAEVPKEERERHQVVEAATVSFGEQR